jgi:hypothetical protein
MNQPSPPVATQPTQHIALDPADWAVATWRPWAPLVRPAPRPFDRAVCLARLRRLLAIHPIDGPLDWNRAWMPLPAALSPEEAHFWLLAMTDPAPDPRQGGLLAELDRLPLTGQVSRAEVRTRLRQSAGHATPQVLVPLAGLLSPPELLDLLLDQELAAFDPHHAVYFRQPHLQMALVDGFCRHVRPYLDDAALEQLRQVARSRLPSLGTQSAAPTP